jgi:single stranded DNA-binding protein
MSVAINNFIISGTMTRDPVLREWNREGEGVPIATFTIAHNPPYKGERGKASFFRVEYWGKGATFVAQRCAKGSQVLVLGSMVEEAWKGKDGTDRTGFKVKAQNVQLIAGPKERERPPEMPVEPPPAAEESDEVPF